MLLQSILAIVDLNIGMKLWVLKEMEQRALAKHNLDGLLSNLLNFNSPYVGNFYEVGKETRFFFYSPGQVYRSPFTGFSWEFLQAHHRVDPSGMFSSWVWWISWVFNDL